MIPPRAKRVAVLGGGIGALAAAYKLTQQDGWQDKFEITVHQLGWRLGGKGASARNTDRHGRIEEHGLHVWAGFYENAFRLMNDAYASRNRPGSPIQTVQQAFLPESHVVLAEQHGGAWLPWQVYFPPQPGWPGDGSTPAPPNPASYLAYILDWLRQSFATLPLPLRLTLPAPPALAIPNHIQALTPAPPSGATAAERLLHQAHGISLFASAGTLPPPDAGDAVGWLLRGFRAQLDALLGLLGQGATELRRLLIVLDLLSSVALAIADEGVLQHGFAVLDRYELTELLRKYGASPQTLASPFIVSAYDYVFGYVGGDRAKPRLSAASAFEGFCRLLFTYKHALFFKMAAGAGEIIFAPLYDVLKARGVRFEFFHRVLEVVPQDGRIDTIRIAVQATPLGPEYDPLIEVGGLACWPAEPLYGQLANGKELREKQINLEDDWQDYSVGETTLRFGTDFDAVILGIPPGALATICAPLAPPGSPWRRMLDGVPTVCTQALQLWSDCSLADLASPFAAPQPDPDPVGPILTSFAPAFDTWADMSHLLKQEDWGAGGPKNVAYFCAVLQDPPPAPPRTDPLPGVTAQVRANAVSWLNGQIGALWPRAVGPAGFRWDLLHAAQGASGDARLDAQYWRANITGSERYVLSLPGTLEARLPPGASGYANLYLAGDWAKVTAINAGCMEVAVMSGFGAAAALAGVPDDTYA